MSLPYRAASETPGRHNKANQGYSRKPFIRSCTAANKILSQFPRFWVSSRDRAPHTQVWIKIVLFSLWPRAPTLEGWLPVGFKRAVAAPTRFVSGTSVELKEISSVDTVAISKTELIFNTAHKSATSIYRAYCCVQIPWAKQNWNYGLKLQLAISTQWATQKKKRCRICYFKVKLIMAATFILSSKEFVQLCNELNKFVWP